MHRGWQLLSTPGSQVTFPARRPVRCHDGSSRVRIQCSCGQRMHLHESQLDGLAGDAHILSRCRTCSQLLRFETDQIREAFEEMRMRGSLNPRPYA